MEANTIHIQTKFLQLREPVLLGDCIDDWRVCWLGGWDRFRVFFVVMVEKKVSTQPADTVESLWRKRLGSGD